MNQKKSIKRFKINSSNHIYKAVSDKLYPFIILLSVFKTYKENLEEKHYCFQSMLDNNIPGTYVYLDEQQQFVFVDMIIPLNYAVCML